MRDDRCGIGLEVLAVAVAGGQSPVEKLRVSPDHRKGSRHIVPGHVEDIFPQSLKIALPRDVTEHDDAALRGASRRTQHGCGQAEDAPLPRAQLDLLLSSARARPESTDDWDERCGDLARRGGPLIEPLLLEWLADDEARAVQAEEFSGRPVQSHDGAPCVN